MATRPETETRAQSVLRRFGSHGFWAGLGLGLVAGVLISGPNFHQWEPRTSFWIVFLCAVCGAIVGFFAVSVATASTTQGPGIGGGIDSRTGGTDTHSGDGIGSTGGDGGGGGGGD